MKLGWNCPNCGTLMTSGCRKDSFILLYKSPHCESFWLISTVTGFDKAVLIKVSKTYYELSKRDNEINYPE